MIAIAELRPDNIDELEQEMKKHVESADGFFAAKIAPELLEIRNLLNSGKTEEAKKHFVDIETMILKAEASYKAEPMAWRLLWIELAYLVFILLLGYVVHMFPGFWLWAGLVNLSSGTAWFGALGGVAVALYGIYGHVQARDFDAKYELWYICKPLMGAVFGWFVYLVYYVGLVSVQGVSVEVKTPAVPYAIAFLAGFSERFTVQIIDKLMEVLATSQAKPDTGPRNF
jgi:hypothetical protein